MLDQMTMGIVAGNYLAYAVFLKQEEFNHLYKITLGIEKSHKEMSIKGDNETRRIVLRGPRICARLKEIYSRMLPLPVEIDYQYIDSMSSPEEYANSFGLDNLDYHRLLNVLQSSLPKE